MTLAQLAEALSQATAHHNQASNEASIARRAETEALNRLNDAQKAMDAAIAKMRNEAKAGDWASRPVRVRDSEARHD
ncbi:hypothetical protein [Sphingobium yanoikuyae]|jgi:hypothetical protein|uniref:hypothetical protein n=1 Tax=Sphingobium yanoikuyae TaxID=13690 RepID=UPI000AD79C04|nr:hypothetical protein [Sphingobium yanoikuyae]